ncbi:MAG: hypothetical protein IRY95_00605, partial [Clostridia bacterium]|nr:hypothetical protein [Clostridia bacterium]
VGWGLLFGPKLEPAPPPRASAVPVTGGRPAEGFIHLLLVNAPAVDGAWLLLNGERVADLRRPLTGVAVRPGDVLAVDARRADGPVVIRVVYLSPGLEAPVPGVEVSAWRRVVPIGRVTAAGGTRERASR